MYFKLKLILINLFFVFAATAHAQTPQIDPIRTKLKAVEALKFSKQKGYNSKYCILIDMSLPSGVKRFMVWDFAKNHILISGLVSHGCGSMPWSATWSKDKPAFSNADGSHCSSLGKYLINGRGYSAWGIHVKYFLSGLENTNSNALARQVVFHSWEKISETEVYPEGTPEGWGCPAVSNNVMTSVDALLKKQKKPILLWIYN